MWLGGERGRVLGGLRWRRGPTVGALLAAWVATVACAEGEPSTPPQGGPPVQRATIEPLPPCPGAPSDVDFRVDTLARGLEIPWDLERAPDQRLFVTERRGRILVVGSRGTVTEWAEVPVFASAEAGLMGIALDPDFGATGRLYVMATARRFGLLRRILRRLPGLSGPTHTLVNQVLRFQAEGGTGRSDAVVVDRLPTNVLHAGGALDFGPDGLLYLTNGDGAVAHAAQDPGDPRGKILRVDPDLTEGREEGAPAAEPFALGLRNVQGLAWHPSDRSLWAVDHGPSGLPWERGLRDRDELLRVEPGSNHGWPWASGGDTFAGAVGPLAVWTPAVAPSDLAFGDQTAEGTVLWATYLRRQALGRILIREDRPVCEDFLFMGTFGRLRSVMVEGMDGLIVTTSNREDQVAAGPEDDLVLRLRQTSLTPDSTGS